MLWRAVTPIPPIVLSLIYTVVFLMAVVCVCLLTVSVVYKFLLLIVCSGYFLYVVIHLYYKQSFDVFKLCENEFLIRVNNDACFVYLQQDSIIMRWFLLLRFQEIGGSRQFVCVRWRKK